MERNTEAAYRDRLLRLQADYSAWADNECPYELRNEAAEEIVKHFPAMCSIVLAAIEWRTAYGSRSVTAMKSGNLGLRSAVDAACTSVS